MIIILVAATQQEILPLIKQLEMVEIIDKRLSRYKCNDLSIYILITGVGMVATAFECGRVFSRFKFDLAINFGIAGTFNSDFNKGDVFEIESDIFADMGAQDGENFLSLAELGLIKENEFPFSNNQLVNKNTIKNTVIETLKKVKGITVNLVHGEEKSIEKTLKLFNPEVESMEGAAFFYSCFCADIPCVQIRAISNIVEKRNREAWNIPIAVKKLNETAIQILKAF
ncbi:MAG: futalosine hydrolase [Bacteroidota bacterium]|nr:futalosine hydrolase [Bacteroidota bacterium]